MAQGEGPGSRTTSGTAGVRRTIRALAGAAGICLCFLAPSVRLTDGVVGEFVLVGRTAMENDADEQSPGCHDDREEKAGTTDDGATKGSPVRWEPSVLEMVLVTIAFILGIYASTFPSSLGCFGLHIVALYPFTAFIWCVPLGGVGFRDLGWSMGCGLLLLCMLLVLPLAAVVVIAALLDKDLFRPSPCDVIIVFSAFVWSTLTLWILIRRDDSDHRKRRAWRHLLAPSLALTLVVLHWAKLPMRAYFSWQRPAIERAVAEAREALANGTVRKSRWGVVVYSHGMPRNIGGYQVKAIAMTPDSEHVAVRTGSGSGPKHRITSRLGASVGFIVPRSLGEEDEM